MAETAGAKFERLLDIMRTLRAPGGCPWDREQTHATLRPYVLEETYEVLEAIESGTPEQLKEELGDFLFEAVFLAQISDEAGEFNIGDALDTSRPSWCAAIRTSSRAPVTIPRSRQPRSWSAGTC